MSVGVDETEWLAQAFGTEDTELARAKARLCLRAGFEVHRYYIGPCAIMFRYREEEFVLVSGMLYMIREEYTKKLGVFRAELFWAFFN